MVGAVLDPPEFRVGGPLDDAMAIDGVSAPDPNENHGMGLINALCDTSSGAGGEAMRRSEAAESHIRKMIEWASHMSIPAVILPPIPSDPGTAARYARLLSTVAPQCSATNVQLWVRTSLSKDSLEAFGLLHRRCDGASNLGCLLCFDPASGATAPAGASSATAAQAAGNVGRSMTLVHRFVGSNLRAASFSTSVFLTNKRGYPTLSKSHQVLFTELLRRLGRTLRVLVEGMPLHCPPLPSGGGSMGAATAVGGSAGVMNGGTAGAGAAADSSSSLTNNPTGAIASDSAGQTGCLAYLQYLRHLRTRAEVSDVLDTDESAQESSYLDHLQSPLQPLGDDLEFQTYETFERDPVKYQRYGAAIQLAVRDAFSLGRLANLPAASSSSDGGKRAYRVTILVAGAGRGPLVRAALEAVDAVNASLSSSSSSDGGDGGAVIVPHVVALEKNASAALYLRSLRAQELQWGECVRVVECDMRRAKNHPLLRLMRDDEAERADVVVSELLGSFGDNELSPECLDGLQTCGLLKRGCVSIPQR